MTIGKEYATREVGRSLTLGNVWDFVQLILGPRWSKNQLYKNRNISKLETSDYLWSEIFEHPAEHRSSPHRQSDGEPEGLFSCPPPPCHPARSKDKMGKEGRKEGRLELEGETSDWLTTAEGQIRFSLIFKNGMSMRAAATSWMGGGCLGVFLLLPWKCIMHSWNRTVNYRVVYKHFC